MKVQLNIIVLFEHFHNNAIRLVTMKKLKNTGEMVVIYCTIFATKDTSLYCILAFVRKALQTQVSYLVCHIIMSVDTCLYGPTS